MCRYPPGSDSLCFFDFADLASFRRTHESRKGAEGCVDRCGVVIYSCFLPTDTDEGIGSLADDAEHLRHPRNIPGASVAATRRRIAVSLPSPPGRASPLPLQWP